MFDFEVIQRDDVLPSLFRIDASTQPVLRVGAVQCAWNPDPIAHREVLRRGVRLAAESGSKVASLQK